MTRLRILWLALLPGLLLSSGVSLRVCLHQLFGLGEGCDACSVGAQTCCGGSERPEGPSAGAHDDCSGCCLELEAEEQRFAPGTRADDHAAPAFALPPAPLGIFAPLLERRATPIRRCGGARASPGAPGILPLRI